MKITESSLPGVLVLTPTIYRDNRGAFWETWNQKEYAETGLPEVWEQDNCSYSNRNVVRGIHYQTLRPQGKLVRVTHGTVFDVAVDLRRSSPNFARHFAIELSAENGQMLYIPVGFGHGFVALTDEVGLGYKVTDYYCPAGEQTILWNDPDLAISWPIASDSAILSDKDRRGNTLSDAEVFE